MAGTTKSDEIFFDIRSQKAARLHMMNLKLLGTSTLLASPAIAVEYLLAKSVIGNRVQAQSRLSWNR